jgi:hypothetical protein
MLSSKGGTVKIISTVSAMMLITLTFGQSVKLDDSRLSPRLLNYQGYLTDTLGNPVTNPSVSMTFGIWSLSGGGSQIWYESQVVSVSKGIFNVLLGTLTPIPDSVFTKSPDRWLELTVAGITLSPRTRIVSSAYAYTSTYSDTAANARLLQGKDTTALDARYVNEGQVNSIFAPMINDTAVTMTKIARAGASTNQVIKWNGSAWQPADDMASADNDWTYLISDGADTTLQMGGRWGLARMGNVLYGPGDSTHVNFGVACTTGTNAVNYKYCTVSGGTYNTASASYATIGGGRENSATVNYSTVSGGWNNDANGNCAVSTGGRDNSAGNNYAVVAGGYADTANGIYTFVGGGYGNNASGSYTVLNGGRENDVTGSYATAGGGYLNNASGSYAAVGGGYRNAANGNYSFAGSGNADTANAIYGFVGSGYRNLAGDSLIDTAAVVAGGYGNSATGKYAFVGGGRANDADTAYAAVVGGTGNTAGGYMAFTGGGQANTASGNYTALTGGRGNEAGSYYTTIGGGYNNTADSSYSTIGGGNANRASGQYSFIGGGQYDTVLACYGSVISGYHNTAGDSFVDTAAVVAGGYNNSALGYFSFVGGGKNNYAGTATPGSVVCGGMDNSMTYSGWAVIGGGRYNHCYAAHATIPGGEYDTVDASWGFATNYRSKATHISSAAFTGSHTTGTNQVRAQSFSTGTLVFTMDYPKDPMNKILNQYAVGSSEAMLMYDGAVILDANGRAVVNLPDYFDDINRNPRIQLTGIGTYEVYVAEKIKGNAFVIGGKPNTEVYWQVTAERRDLHAEIARLRTPVVQEKTGDLRGHSLDDDALIGISETERLSDPELFRFKTEEGRGVHEHLKAQIEELKNK